MEATHNNCHNEQNFVCFGPYCFHLILKTAVHYAQILYQIPLPFEIVFKLVPYEPQILQIQSDIYVWLGVIE